MSSFFSKLLNNPKYRRKLRFSRHVYPELYDCKIKCNNNQIISCHKCILVSRCEYFKNMLLGCWIESSQQVIELPFDVDLMQIIVDYLYTDDIEMEFIHSSGNISASVKSKNEREIEILFNLFILSDQMLLERLKNVCEFKLANLINLKNATEILEFSNEYEAKQLKDFTMEFIVCNLVTLIEAKQLENVCLQLLKDLSKFYRSYFPLVESRIITPYQTGLLDIRKIDLIPIELLYDQKFIDGGQEDDNCVSKRRVLISQETYAYLPSKSNEIAVSKTELEEIAQVKEEVQKWEKVKKKDRRKISEKEINLNPVCLSKQVSPIPVETSFLNSPKSLEKESPTELWPSLSDMKVVQKKESPPMISEKKKTTRNNKQSKPVEVAKSPVTPVWGGVGVAVRERINSEVTNFSLIDVMNEEMKKMKVSPTNESPVSSKKSFSNKSSVIKTPELPVKSGWNLPSNQAFPSMPCSIANIIEMEKRSKDQYRKLTNRSLNTIQVEEAAVERIKRYYDVENVFDITIKIELIEDADFKDCAPLWRKK